MVSSHKIGSLISSAILLLIGLLSISDGFISCQKIAGAPHGRQQRQLKVPSLPIARDLSELQDHNITHRDKQSISQTNPQMQRPQLISKARQYNQTAPQETTEDRAKNSSVSMSQAPKRFKASRLQLREPLSVQNSNRISSLSNVTANASVALTSEASRNASSNDLSSILDMNNNIIPTDRMDSDKQSWSRNVNSINGTIDLSRYQQDDVDRLYGDALLVYFKNFNDTLPARREMISVNGSTNRIPMYRSETRFATKPKSQTDVPM